MFKTVKNFIYSWKISKLLYCLWTWCICGSHDNHPTLKKCLFGAVILTKNADVDKYGYSGYGVGFDRRSAFSFLIGGFGQNVLVFGVNMSSSAHINIKKKDILILWKGPTQGLEPTLFN